MSRHSCYTTDPKNERGGSKSTVLQDGWIDVTVNGQEARIPRMVPHTTDWLPMKCGRLDQVNYTDPDCIGCAFDKEPKGCQN